MPKYIVRLAVEMAALAALLFTICVVVDLIGG